MPLLALRVALGIGFAIDAVVAMFSLFAPAAMGPLFDIPLKDPSATAIAGGEFLVVSLLYLVVLRSPLKYRNLLWLVALDQALAVALTANEIRLGHIAATWKTVTPIPFQALLAVIYVLGRRQLGARSEFGRT